MRVSVLIALSTVLLGCDNNQTERQLMSNPSSARSELERRITEWVTVKDGLIILVEHPDRSHFSIHAIPASTPWIVSSTSSGLQLGFAFLLVEGESTFVRDAKKYLTTAPLSEQQCKALVPVVGQAMTALTSTK